MARKILIHSYRLARRIAVGVVGGTVLALGVALLVLPGPAFVLIPVGLAILALEFGWARRWLRHVRERSEALLGSSRDDARGQRTARGPEGPPAGERGSTES